MSRLSASGISVGIFTIAMMATIVFWDTIAGGAQEKVVAHEQAECSRCHAMVADLDGVEAERNLTSECLKCHQLKSVDYHGITLGFHESQSLRCQNCHSFHTPNAVQASSRTITTSAKSDAYLAHCVSCHQSGMKTASLSVGHQEAVTFYHSNSQVLNMLSPSEGCLVCHSNRGGGHLETATKGNQPRFNEMASHPYGIAYKWVKSQESQAEGGTPEFHPLLIDGRIECQPCHRLTSQMADYLDGGGVRGSLCSSCHES